MAVGRQGGDQGARNETGRPGDTDRRHRRLPHRRRDKSYPRLYGPRNRGAGPAGPGIRPRRSTRATPAPRRLRCERWGRDVGRTPVARFPPTAWWGSEAPSFLLVDRRRDLRGPSVPTPGSSSDEFFGGGVERIVFLRKVPTDPIGGCSPKGSLPGADLSQRSPGRTAFGGGRGFESRPLPPNGPHSRIGSALRRSGGRWTAERIGTGSVPARSHTATEPSMGRRSSAGA